MKDTKTEISLRLLNRFYPLDTVGSELKFSGKFIKETLEKLNNGASEEQLIKEYDTVINVKKN